MLDGVEVQLHHLRDVAAYQLAAVQLAQLLKHRLVHGQHAAIGTDGDQCFMQQAGELRAAVEAQDEGVTELVEEVRARDLRRRHAHQRHGMALDLLAVLGIGGGGIQHRQQPAVRVQDRRAAARQRQVPGQVMLAAVHAHRGALGRAGAKPVGALMALGPAGAGKQAHLAEFAQQGRVVHAVQHGGVGIGKDHCIATAGDLLVEVFHLHPGDPQDIAQPLLALAHMQGVMHHRVRQRLRQQGVVLQAATPGTRQRRRQRRDIAQPADLLEQFRLDLRQDDGGAGHNARLGHGPAFLEGREAPVETQTGPMLKPHRSKARRR